MYFQADVGSLVSVHRRRLIGYRFETPLGQLAPMVNGGDIQSFIACYTTPGDTCDCADIDGTLGIESSDLAAFVDELLAGVSCP